MTSIATLLPAVVPPVLPLAPASAVEDGGFAAMLGAIGGSDAAAEAGKAVPPGTAEDEVTATEPLVVPAPASAQPLLPAARIEVAAGAKTGPTHTAATTGRMVRARSTDLSPDEPSSDDTETNVAADSSQPWPADPLAAAPTLPTALPDSVRAATPPNAKVPTLGSEVPMRGSPERTAETASSTEVAGPTPSPATLQTAVGTPPVEPSTLAPTRAPEPTRDVGIDVAAVAPATASTFAPTFPPAPFRPFMAAPGPDARKSAAVTLIGAAMPVDTSALPPRAETTVQVLPPEPMSRPVHTATGRVAPTFAPAAAAPVGSPAQAGPAARMEPGTPAAPRQPAAAAPVADTATLLVQRAPNRPRAAVSAIIPEVAVPLTAPAPVLAPDNTTPALPVAQIAHATASIAHIDRLRDAAEAVSTSIRLHPDALGPIDVSVETQGDVTHVRLSAEQAGTRALLADAQPRLAEIAAERGVRLGRAEVGSGAAGNGGDRPQRPQPPRPTATPPRARRDAGAPTDVRVA